MPSIDKLAERNAAERQRIAEVMRGLSIFPTTTLADETMIGAVEPDPQVIHGVSHGTCGGCGNSLTFFKDIPSKCLNCGWMGFDPGLPTDPNLM